MLGKGVEKWSMGWLVMELDEGKEGERETPPTRSTREFHLQSKYCRNANTLVLVVALLHWYWYVAFSIYIVSRTRLYFCDPRVREGGLIRLQKRTCW